MSILKKVYENKQKEVAAARAVQPDNALAKLAMDTPIPTDFIAAIRDPARAAPRLIAEVKRQSPSKGVLRPDLDVLDMAKTYAAHGAAAISVLTDEKFFGGSLKSLQEIASLKMGIPLLRKDFVFHRYQIMEARAFGASAVLLIGTLLEERTLQELIADSLALNLAPLVEVHTRSELDTAMRCGAKLIGINNRNLHTFDVRLETTLELCRQLPAGTTVVAESGIHTLSDVKRLAEAGVEAMLIGESLVTATDVAGKVRRLAQVGRMTG